MWPKLFAVWPLIEKFAGFWFKSWVTVWPDMFNGQGRFQNLFHVSIALFLGTELGFLWLSGLE